MFVFRDFMHLPSVKSREVVSVLRKAGFVEIRQSGSHLILVNKTKRKITTVPLHAKELKRGLLVAIIKQSGLTIDEFMKLL